MILRIFLLTCAIMSLSLGRLTWTDFNKKFVSRCFGSSFRVNGQRRPLSNTIENFISLAEKFERENLDSLDLKQELAFFLQEYRFDNMKITRDEFNELEIEGTVTKDISDMWDPALKDYRPESIKRDVFSEAEECSLVNMISHSIMYIEEEKFYYSLGRENYSLDSNGLDDGEPKVKREDYYPQEIGVVAIRGTDAAVSLGSVLTGLYVGLDPGRYLDINNDKYDLVNRLLLDDTEKAQLNSLTKDNNKLDALYAVTLAEVLMLSNWTTKIKHMQLAPDGHWVSIPLTPTQNISDFCPMVYKHAPEIAKRYSYSSVRGAADGLILGSSIYQIYEKKQNTKLSQILRMYYSPEGITVKNTIDESKTEKISFCNRKEYIQTDVVENKLRDQMQMYGYLVTKVFDKVITVYNSAYNYYQDIKEKIYEPTNSVIRDYCAATYDTQRPENLPRETFMDVIAVMDSHNGEESFRRQQLILGKLAKRLDLRYTGSKMTILLDRKLEEFSAPKSLSAIIKLVPVVEDTYSSSCAACMAGQITYDESRIEPIETDQIITAIDQFLKERKDNESDLSGTNGKVVIYFNYEGEKNAQSTNKIQGRLEQALRNLHLNHQDVHFFAAGPEGSEVLKRYAKNQAQLTFWDKSGTPTDEIAQKIFDKISYEPALLQYIDCKDAKNEKTATFENFVSPRKIQHYEMPAQYFYKSRGLSFTFESKNGYINVCINRKTKRPENEARNCKNTSASISSVEFKESNPCKGFEKETCSPFYFSIMGMDTSLDMKSDIRERHVCDDLKNGGNWCSNLDQIYYKVSHDGIRCSGCLGLAAQPAVILFTVLLTYFVCKRF